MKTFTVAALVALIASAASIANARDDGPGPEPSAEEIRSFASFQMGMGLENKLSEREIANSLASEIIW